MRKSEQGNAGIPLVGNAFEKFNDPAFIESWVKDVWAQENLKSHNTKPLNFTNDETFGERLKNAGVEAVQLIKDHPYAFVYWALNVVTAVIDGQMYILPGEELAAAQRASRFLYVSGGFIPNTVLPIAFAAQLYNALDSLINPHPLNPREHGRLKVINILTIAVVLGIFSALPFGALELTEGFSAGIIVLAVFVTLGNAVMNGKGLVDLVQYPSIILPLLKKGWFEIRNLCRSKAETRTERRAQIAAEAQSEYLNLAKRVLADGNWRIKNLLLQNPTVTKMNFDMFKANFGQEFPNINEKDFTLLTKTFNRRMNGPEGTETLAESFTEFTEKIQLLVHASRIYQPREYPHIIRVLIGWPAGLLSNISTSGYYAVLFLQGTKKFGDVAGYTLAATSSSVFTYLVWVVGLDAAENYVKTGYDLARISVQKIQARINGKTHQIPSYFEIMPTILRTHPIPTTILATALVGTAAYSWPTSVQATLVDLPMLLAKWTAPLVPYVLINDIANALVWPTKIGAFLFNGQPMANVAWVTSKFSVFSFNRFFPEKLDSNKLVTMEVEKEFAQNIGSIFGALNKYSIPLLRFSLSNSAQNSVANEDHDFQNNNNVNHEPKHPFERYTEDYSEEKAARKSSCGARWFSYFGSFFCGRPVGGEQYAANIRGENFNNWEEEQDSETDYLLN